MNKSKLYEVLTSRKFYTSLAGVLLVLFGFELTPEIQVALISVITSGFMLATGVESGLDKYGNGQVNLKDKGIAILKSRKFYALVATIVAATGIDLDPEFAASAVAVATAVFGLGTAIESGLRTR